jgi:glucokinase
VSIANTIEEVIRASNVNRQRIIGLGVGAPGLIDYERGVILVAPNLNWRNVPVRDFLEDQLGQLVVVDNNVRAMALGEAFFGSGRGANSLAFVYGRVGVGAGFVVNGQVFRGSNAGAGEIGHTVMLAQGGELCGCGNRGCLETLVSETALLREASLCARDHPDSLLAGYLTQASDVPPVDLIFRAAREGDPYSAEMIKQRAGYLGLALANLVNVFNPELILLGGMFSQGEDLFLPEATATMRKNAFAGLGEKVRLQTTSFGWRAGVIGAAALALTTNFYQQTG